jgi:intracellular proteinase inhibitor BsuPI/S-layer family protein
MIPSRVQAAALFALAAALVAGVAPASAAIFSDIQNDPNQRGIEKLAVTGVMAGFPDGTFKPTEPITRLAAVAALARGLDVKGTGTIPNYKDLAEIPEDVRPAIAALLNTGAVSQQKSEVKKGDVVYTLSTDKAVYAIDDPVDLTFTVTNTGKDDVKFAYDTNQQYDFIVKLGDTEVARWSLGQTFVRNNLDLVLAPGKSFVFNTRWLQKNQDSQLVPSGNYEIIGISPEKDDTVTVTLQFQKGLLTTFPDNTFRPNAQVSRAEFAALLDRSLGKQGEATQKASAPLSISDAADVPATLHGYVAVAIDSKLMPPYSDGSWHANAPTTRGEAAGAVAAVMSALNKFNYVKGKLVSIGSNGITLSVEQSAVQSYALTPSVAVYRNDKVADPGDLKPDDEVLMLLTGPRGRAGYIEATGQ